MRLIDDKGQMAGVMTPAQALVMAEEVGLDLIEIAPNAKPPTCKIMDYGKYKYENKKKAVASRKNQAVVSVKEIQVRPRTDDHDLSVKTKHAVKFLLEGSKVKVNLRFSGREMAHQDLGLVVLEKVIKLLDKVSNVEAPPKKEGRFMFTIVAPDAAKIKEYKDLLKRERKLEEREAAAESGETLKDSPPSTEESSVVEEAAEA